MKKIKSFKNYSINEEIEYDADWKSPESKIRTNLVNNLEDILLDIKDLGYDYHISGFIKLKSPNSPFIWICNKEQTSRGTKKRIPFKWEDEFNETLLRIEDYLKIEGFKTERFILNKGRSMEQLYINFDKIEQIKENYSNKEDFEELVKDCFSSFTDEGWIFIGGDDNQISNLGYPSFFFDIISKEQFESDNLYQGNEYINYSGFIKNGKIIEEDENFNFYENSKLSKQALDKYLEDFKEAIFRLSDIANVEFRFSFHTKFSKSEKSNFLSIKLHGIL